MAHRVQALRRRVFVLLKFQLMLVYIIVYLKDNANYHTILSTKKKNLSILKFVYNNRGVFDSSMSPMTDIFYFLSCTSDIEKKKNRIQDFEWNSKFS